MPHIMTNGKNLYYEFSKDVTNRPTLVLVHGAGGDRTMWNFQIDDLSQSCNLLSLELPGHGEAVGEGEEDITKYSQAVLGVLSEVSPPFPYLVGHSMGGAVVLDISLNPPKSLQGIILVGTGAKLKVIPQIFQGIKENFNATVRRICETAVCQESPSYVLQKCIGVMMKSNHDVLYGDFLACDSFNIIDKVDQITLPTLILCGEEDKLTPPKYSQYLAEKIKGSKLELIPKAGHMAMLEQPKEFNKKVLNFLSLKK